MDTKSCEIFTSKGTRITTNMRSNANGYNKITGNIIEARELGANCFLDRANGVPSEFEGHGSFYKLISERSFSSAEFFSLSSSL